jgi:hypothetical protein
MIPVIIGGVVQRRSDSATQGKGRHRLNLTQTGGGRRTRIDLGKSEDDRSARWQRARSTGAALRLSGVLGGLGVWAGRRPARHFLVCATPGDPALVAATYPC